MSQDRSARKRKNESPRIGIYRELHLSWGYGDMTLACPCCDSLNLHQRSYEVFTGGEDSAYSGLAIAIGPPDLAVSIASEKKTKLKNPSARRDGIRIWFDCEGCDYHSALAIVQHKGDTYLFWDTAKLVPEEGLTI
jgi:hypothetical protein